MLFSKNDICLNSPWISENGSTRKGKQDESMAGSNTRKMAKLWQAAQEHDLTYSFVYRRWNGQIDLYKK